MLLRPLKHSLCNLFDYFFRTLLDEDHPQVPVSPYGESKLFIERACQWYDAAYSLRYVSLRYFNAAGADASGELGESHVPETHLIPLAIGTSLGLYPELTINGTDFPTADGTAVRDYVHVSDVADAHVAALQYLESGGASERLNLGTGKGVSVSDIVETVQRLSGISIPTRGGERRPGDPAVLIASAQRAERVLGWKPSYTDIDAIIATAWDWSISQLAGSVESGLVVADNLQTT